MPEEIDLNADEEAALERAWERIEAEDEAASKEPPNGNDLDKA